MNYKYDYFVSYAQEDVKDGFIGEFVERLAKNPDLEALLGAKPRVFFDQEAARNMDEWDDAVQAAIDASRVLIVLLSPNYFKSERCAMEFARWFEGAERGALPYAGIAPFQIADVFSDGPVDVPQELQDRFPNWASVLRKSQIFADFDLRDRLAASIDRALAALGGPYLSDAYMELGCSSAMAGDDKQAREHFAKALEIAKKAFERAPEDPKAMSSLRAAYGSLGVVLASEGDYKQARELYERAGNSPKGARANAGRSESVKRAPRRLCLLRRLSGKGEGFCTGARLFCADAGRIPEDSHGNAGRP
ncbi:MAG: toll/interleukin-1 receptor domain-containing protein [Thermoguttaceae bacterium]|nr:toll/interleukin-1 receptor domain-containing protein [Thermoguttaceae bacterium]